MPYASHKSPMETSPQGIIWHYETLPDKTRRALELFSHEPWLKDSPWYLAGGTALALQTGHRASFDLDFFTAEKAVDETGLLATLTGREEWQTEQQSTGTLYGELLGTKISFIVYPFFIPTHPVLWHENIKVLDKRDIAVMKVVALSQRGEKRDFFDLYWCARNLEPLESIVKRLPEQYPTVAHNYHHILKALVYFEDAQDDPDLMTNYTATWKEVKAFFEREVKRIAPIVMGI